MSLTLAIKRAFGFEAQTKKQEAGKIDEAIKYKGPSLKCHIKNAYASIDEYPQYWRGFAHEIPVKAPRIKKEDCIFWGASWLRGGNYVREWCNGEFNETEFVSDGIVLELNEYQKRFEQLILGQDRDIYAPSMFPKDGIRNQTRFKGISVDGIVDSPEAIEIISSDLKVKEHIKELLHNQYYEFLDYAHFSAVHSHYKGLMIDKELSAVYHGEPTILYIWTIQGFDGSHSSNSISSVLDAKTSKVLHVEYKEKMKRSFGT